MLQTAGPAAAAADDIVRDTTTQGFLKDVIEESRRQPVLVDFWAPWCGPCKQLGPALERAVTAAKGAVKLVKIDIDQNPAYAGQLRVQSIPAVFAFADGRPVDGFTGALPESEVKRFVEKLAKKGGDPLVEMLDMARESLALGDIGGAAQAYAQVLQADPNNLKALGGLAKVYQQSGDLERAAEIVEMAGPEAHDPDLDSVRAALALVADAPSETAEFEARIAADPDDHEARFALAKALAGSGRMAEAVDELLEILRRDRAWNDEAARKQVLTIFEAAGPMSEVAKAGRRKLSAVLFT